MYVALWGATKVIHLAIAYKIVNINDYKFYKTKHVFLKLNILLFEYNCVERQIF